MEHEELILEALSMLLWTQYFSQGSMQTGEQKKLLDRIDSTLKMIEEDKTVEFVDVKVIKKVAKIPKNSIIVKTKQPALKLIPLLLEPQSSYGFVSIGSGLQYRFTQYLQEGKMYPIERILKFIK